MFYLVFGDKTGGLFLKALHTKKVQTILIEAAALLVLFFLFQDKKSSLKLVTCKRGKYSHNAPPFKGRKPVKLIEQCKISAAVMVVA